MESAFAIIAEPNRRAILTLLASAERTVSELEQQLQMSQPSVSKHLRVLRDAGFVEARVDAQRRVYQIRPEPLMELDAWLAPFRRFWDSHVDALERHLDRMAQAPAKRKKGEQPMNIALWILQVVVAFLSVSGGAFQIFKFDDLKKGVAAMRELPRGLWALFGAIGCVAGLCLILPGALGVLPGLTALAAAVIAAENALISALYLKYGDRPPLPYSALIALLAAFVAYGRFALQPL